MMVGACELLFLVPSFVRPLQRYVFSTATSRIFGADLDSADQFSAGGEENSPLCLGTSTKSAAAVFLRVHKAVTRKPSRLRGTG